MAGVGPWDGANRVPPEAAGARKNDRLANPLSQESYGDLAGPAAPGSLTVVKGVYHDRYRCREIPCFDLPCFWDRSSAQISRIRAAIPLDPGRWPPGPLRTRLR